MELCQPDTIGNVSENFLDGGILDVIEEVNLQADPKLIELNSAIMENYASHIKGRTLDGADAATHGLPRIIENLQKVDIYDPLAPA